jgi:hypothetical protein
MRLRNSGTMARKTKLAIDVILNTRVSAHPDVYLLQIRLLHILNARRVSEISGAVRYAHSLRIVRRQLSQLLRENAR